VLRKIEIRDADGVGTADLSDLFEEAIRLSRVNRLDEATTIASFCQAIDGATNALSWHD
jgi:hypothetical protein